MYKGDILEKLKKMFSIIGTISLICFSFYYTDSAVDIIRKTDPIMKEIEEYSNNFGNTSIDSILVNNNIIPGIKGNIVDIDKSYNNMKRLGKFDKSLIVFEEVLPTNTITDNYDNYIIAGNATKSNVSIVVLMEDSSYIEEIIKILSQKNAIATFFVTSELLDDSDDLVSLILASGNKLELLDPIYEVKDVKKINLKKKLLSNESLNYCLTFTKNSSLLNNCKDNKLHTIIPTIYDENYPYTEVKNNLKNGSIIAFKNNQNTLRELNIIINYINQKGKKIILLEKLLEE